MLVYFGQGALLLRNPTAIENQFFRMAPHWALYPLIALATMATVIASQALISGAFSLTSQSVKLGYSPRVHVRHTSDVADRPDLHLVAQLDTPARLHRPRARLHTANLAAAYGVAVTTTMVLTTVLFFVVARERFRWKTWFIVPLCSIFFLVDVAFFGATLFKIPDGGWFPLVVGAVVFSILTTWRTGRRLVQDRLLRRGVPLSRFVERRSRHHLRDSRHG